MNGLARTLAFVASLVIIIGVLFTSLQLAMNDSGWYAKKYEKYGTADEIGISNEDITRAIMALVDYMEGRVDTIDLDVVENGVTVSMYNDRERAHMVDVRALYQAWRAVRDIGMPAGAVALLIAFILAKKGHKLGTLSGGFLWASAAFVALLAGLGVWVVRDFNGFWTAFHHLFFTNDLWLLNYATDRMIRICPEVLFSDIVIRFALMFLIPFILMIVAAIALFSKRHGKKKEAGV